MRNFQCLYDKDASVLEKWIEAFFVSDGSCGSVTRSDDGLVRESKNLLTDAVDECGHITTHEIGATDTAIENGVTRNQQTALWKVKRQSARTVPGNMQHLNRLIANQKRVTVFEFMIDYQFVTLHIKVEISHLPREFEA